MINLQKDYVKIVRNLDVNAEVNLPRELTVKMILDKEHY